MDSVDNVIYIWLFLMIFVVISLFRRSIIRKFISKRKNTERKNIMNEILNSCIGKMCDIYIYGELGTGAKIVSVSDGWVEVEKKNGKRDLINIDYISRISVKEKG